MQDTRQTEFKQWADRLRGRYLWLPPEFSLEAESGWAHTINLMLDRIEVALGWTSARNRFLDYLELATGRTLRRRPIKVMNLYVHGRGMRVTWEGVKSLSSARSRMVDDVINEFQNAVSRVCEKCGTPIEKGGFRSDTACKEHTGYRGYRYEMLARDQAELDAIYQADDRQADNLDGNNKEDGNSPSDESGVSGKASEGEVLPVNGGETPEEGVPDASEAPTPALQIYDVDLLDKLIDRATKDSTDNTLRKRKTTMLKECKDLGGTRPYALIENVSALCDGLRQDFPNFLEAIDCIEADVVISQLKNRLRIRPLLLDGPPGVGKSKFGQELARRLGSGFEIIHMESAQSGAELAGSAEYWSNSQPGKVFRRLVYGATANPVFLIDELDKVSARSEYSPTGALYALLEEDTAKHWEDLAMMGFKLNTSGIIWLITANEVESIPEPLMSRVTRVSIKQPTREQAAAITRNIYTQKVNEYLGEEYVFEVVLDDAIVNLVTQTPPRGIAKLLGTAIGRAVRDKRHALLVSDIPVCKSRRGIGFNA